MIRHRFARILLAAGLAATPLAFANGGIVKCIGPSGHVTLTDTSCGAGERAVTVIPAAAREPATATPDVSPAAAPSARPAATLRTSYAASRVPLARLDPPSRSLARDVMTLKAARQALTLMDGAADALQSRRVAGLR